MTIFTSIGHFTAKRKSPYFVRLFQFCGTLFRLKFRGTFFTCGMLCESSSFFHVWHALWDFFSSGNIHVLYINAYYKNAIWALWKQVSTNERSN